uniref:Uncharacterized protein n=1 Tax=Dulem virus 36 TaxID=3145754 RepID=A0AAU8B090_9CAUD
MRAIYKYVVTITDCNLNVEECVCKSYVSAFGLASRLQEKLGNSYKVDIKEVYSHIERR